MNPTPCLAHPSTRSLLLLAAVWLAAAETGKAQQLYFEDFEVDHTANWTANPGAGNNDADFFFDYSTVGIPSAPRSIGGTTRGVRLRANFATPGVFTGISVSPNGQNFSGNYRVTFDFWSNFNGNANGSGSGTTQLTGAGIGTSGTAPQHAGLNTVASLWFAQTGDGGNSPNSKDYRAYSSAAVGGGSGFTGAGYATNSGVYAAGTGATSADNANAYYAALGGNTVPAEQTALAATQLGTTAAGAPAFKWHTGEILKVGNTVKYSIDGLLIFTVDASSLTFGGGNIQFIQSDINAGVSTDPTAPTYAFGLFDNITVSNVPSVVSVTATTPIATEAGPTDGIFTLSRTGDTGAALTVNYLLSGTATNGVDYVMLPGSVTFAGGASSTNIAVKPISDFVPEISETVVFTIDTGADYFIGSPNTATVVIIDNDVPTLSITAPQPILLEGFSSNRATVAITRIGRTNSALTVNLTYNGTATNGTDFTGPATVALAAGAVTTNFSLTPIDDKIFEGTETAIVNLASNGLSYAVGTPGTVTVNVIDNDLPPAVTLFADAFDYSDTVTNWVVNQFTGDTFSDFAFDYSTVGIPEAPSSTGSFAPRLGLKLRANENFTSLTGLSLSPANGNYTNDYRLRFDLWINYAGPLNNVNVPGQTQNATAGVGTTGVETVWPGGSAAAGVWFSVNGDGGTATADYSAFSGMTVYPTNSGVYAAGTGTTARDNGNAYYAPWTAVSAPAAQTSLFPSQTGSTFAGNLGMAWHSVAITKRGANVTWDVDGYRVATVDITALTLANNVFVGYYDPFASVTTNAPVQFGLFDNVRVETLGRPTLTSIQIVSGGTSVRVDFKAEFEDTPDLFDLVTAPTVNGTYLPASSEITSLGGNQFRAVTAIGSSRQFYRVKRK